jgi:proline dehydrogenase
MISFDDTRNAFAYKSDKELKKAYRLFSLMDKLWLVKLGTKLMPLAVKWYLPFARKISRNTIFKEFVGGETLASVAVVTNKLQQYNVGAILDYGVEAGETEATFDKAEEEFIHAIRYAATQKAIPFISIKITGIARFALLEKIHGYMHGLPGTLIEKYEHALYQLNDEEQLEWNIVCARMQNICEAAFNKKTGVLIDAEETWIQGPIDALGFLMMESFNKEQATIFITMQLYLTDRAKFLQDCYVEAIAKKYIPGIKLVRGAYMEKERARAKKRNYPSPVQPDKASCDTAYNTTMEFCIKHLGTISLVIASHNEESNLLATQLLQQNNIAPTHPHICFSQLYGMGDHISFNLAKAGYHVCKYLPYGPLTEVIPYLMRRAEENSSVSGQTGRELSLIRKELKQRASNNGQPITSN